MSDSGVFASLVIVIMLVDLLLGPKLTILAVGIVALLAIAGDDDIGPWKSA